MRKYAKALVSLALAGAMVFSAAGCGSSGSPAQSTGSSESAAASADHVLNIWCWNDEFQSRFNDYYPEVKEVAQDKSTTTLNDGTVVKWTINPNQDNNYQDKLDEALLAQDSKADNEKIDIDSIIDIELEK